MTKLYLIKWKNESNCFIQLIHEEKLKGWTLLNVIKKIQSHANLLPTIL